MCGIEGCHSCLRQHRSLPTGAAEPLCLVSSSSTLPRDVSELLRHGWLGSAPPCHVSSLRSIATLRTPSPPCHGIVAIPSLRRRPLLYVNICFKSVKEEAYNEELVLFVESFDTLWLKVWIFCWNFESFVESLNLSGFMFFFISPMYLLFMFFVYGLNKIWFL